MDSEHKKEAYREYMSAMVSLARDGVHSQCIFIALLNILLKLEIYLPHLKHGVLQSDQVERYYKRMNSSEGRDE